MCLCCLCTSLLSYVLGNRTTALLEENAISLASAAITIALMVTIRYLKQRSIYVEFGLSLVSISSFIFLNGLMIPAFVFAGHSLSEKAFERPFYPPITDYDIKAFLEVIVIGSFMICRTCTPCAKSAERERYLFRTKKMSIFYRRLRSIFQGFQIITITFGAILLMSVDLSIDTAMLPAQPSLPLSRLAALLTHDIFGYIPGVLLVVIIAGECSRILEDSLQAVETHLNWADRQLPDHVSSLEDLSYSY